MNIPQFSVRRRVTTTMILGIIIVFGFTSLRKIGLEMFPELEFPMITVATGYPGASSEDVERLVTQPIEESIATVKNVKDIKSISIEGFSIVMVEFEWGTNLDFVAEDIRNNIALIRDAYLPEDITTPTVQKFNMAQMPVIYYLFSSPKMNEIELRKLVEDVVKDRIERIDGVAAAMVMGGREREVQVRVDKDRINALGISLDQIVNMIRAENMNLPAGNLEINKTEYLIRTTGEFASADDMKNIAVGYAGGAPVFLRDVAEIRDTHKEIRNYVRSQGNPAVVMMVSKESGANTIDVANAVKAEMKEIEKILPSHVRYDTTLDQGIVVERLLSKTSNTGIIGAILAMILMFLFLKNWRPTLIIGLAIPISIVVSFIPIYGVGYTLNFMTIIGMVLGVGMVVDNGVVVIENIFRHLELGEPINKAAEDGAAEVGMAITASTLTTIAVFLPLAFIEGLTGQFSKAVSLTIASALLSSLFIALTMVPMLASIMLKKGKGKSMLDAGSGRLFTRFKQWYLSVLVWTLNNKKKSALIILLAFFGSLALIPLIGAEFMPNSDHPMQMLKIEAPVGTPLEETNNFSKVLESKIMSMPETLVTVAMVGTEESSKADIASGFNPAGSNEAMLMFKLKFMEDRKRSAHEILEEIRQSLPDAHGVNVTMFDMGQAMMGGGNAPIEIKVFGKKLDDLMKLSDRVAEMIKKVKGIRDVRVSLKPGKPEYQISIDRQRAARYGVNTFAAAFTVKTATVGSTATRMREGSDEYDVRVQFADVFRDTLPEIETIPITTPMKLTIPIKQVANISKGRGPLKINRENQSRVSYVYANIYERPLSMVTDDITKLLTPIRKELPAGYDIEIGGAFKDMKEAMRELSITFFFAILLVYMIMASQFESFKYPFIIMFTMPLAVIGVLIALFIAGKTFSVPSGMGIVMLMGIVVNNAIVYIDYVNQLRAKGMKVRDALVEAGAVRLRPILITALTTIGGMIPMAVSHSQGANMRSPMAIAIIGGLLASTALTLVVIPMVYEAMTKDDTAKENIDAQ